MSAARQTIHFGFEIGTGEPVAIPLRHTAVTGQTQEAGKTTALEGLIYRSGLRALAFLTKRGEGAFTTARNVAPYFRERADWQFVAAVLEATLREKLKFERAWIIRASKGARSLADVQANVRGLMEKAKGLSADVYLTLDSYLSIVVPQIDTALFAPRVELGAGLNVMSLDRFSTEMQALVIRSSLEWIYENERNTVAILPEAWEFIPQQRGSPVKLAAEELIRKGAGLKNYVWLDSQDIAAVHKDVLRSVPVWILGVQREANEIKRVLAHIPQNVSRPRISDVMELGLGEFFVCYGKHVIRAYAQPSWMAEEEARAVALGERSVHDTASPVVRRPAPQAQPQGEPNVKESEARALRAENERLQRENRELNERVARLERATSPEAAVTPTETMAPADPVAAVDEEALYQRIVGRLREDPVLLRIATTRPEIEVEVKREVIKVDGGKSMLGRVGKLLAQDFFRQPRSFRDVLAELQRTGPQANNASLGAALKDLVAKGFLTKEGTDFQAVPGMKSRIVEV